MTLFRGDSASPKPKYLYSPGDHGEVDRSNISIQGSSGQQLL